MAPSLRQIQVLAVLAGAARGTLGSSELAERLRTSARQLGPDLDALVGYGAVAVAPAGRQVTVTITSQGRRIHERATTGIPA